MARMPGAQWRPLSTNYRRGGNRPRVVILHIIVGTLAGADAWFRNPSSRVSAHFGTSRAGLLRQWVDTENQAWANRSANSYSISIENEGTVGDALTDEQLTNCAKVLAWANPIYGIEVRVNNSVSGSGLSYHRMSATWGVTACPGNPIIAQRNEIIRRARRIQGGAAPTPPAPRELIDVARYERWTSSLEMALPKDEPVAIRWNWSGTNDKVSDSNRYVTFVFAYRKFTGSINLRVVPDLSKGGSWDKLAYRVFLGRAHDDDPGAAPPAGRYHSAIYTNSEANHSLDGMSSKNSHQRLRVYVEALESGLQITSAQLRGWSAPR